VELLVCKKKGEIPVREIYTACSLGRRCLLEVEKISVSLVTISVAAVELARYSL